MKKFVWMVRCALLGVVVATTSAQQQTASLTGQVTDSSGAAVSGATVTVVDTDRGSKQVVKTNEQGIYQIPQLPPAEHYSITVERAGFKTTVQKNVVLQIAQAAKIDLTVSVGEVSEAVTVEATPPQLEAESSSLGQVITGQTVESLPLNGRSSFRLIALTPGVTFSQSAYGQFGDVAVNSTFDTNFSINGGRAQSNEILINGVPSSAGFFNQITTLPIVDETEEFKVESNNLSAIYGRFAGGVVNVTTKSGTNRIHGNVFEFLRNDAFDANDWFNKHAIPQVRRPPFHMNQFGGTIGGPVVIPHLYNGRDRTFFFFGYQGTRRVKGTPFTATVPTDLERSGDFSQLCSVFDLAGKCVSTVAGKNIQIYNPYAYDPVSKTRAIYPFNKITSNLDPVAAKILTYLPHINNGDQNTLTSNYISNSPVRLSQEILTARIDQTVTQKYHLSGRYAFSTTPLTQPNVYNNVASTGASAVGTTTFRNQSFSFDNVYQVSDSWLINANYGFARWFQSRQTRSYGFDNSTLGFPSSFVSKITIPMFPSITIGGGYSGLAGQSYLSNGNDSHAFLVSATKTWGKQTIIFGGDFRIHRINFFNVSNSAGDYSFAIAQTQGPIPTTATANAGNAFASFLLGFGSSGTIPIGSGSELQDKYAAIYLQDNIHLTQKLTLNLGVRYDGETPYVDRHNQLNYFDLNVPSPARNPTFPNLNGGLVFANTGSTGREVYTHQLNNVVPRVGFAYAAQSTTVFRGGAGIVFAPLEISNNAVGFVPALGFASSTAWNTSNDGGITPANLLSNPYPNGFVQPSGSSLGAGTQLGQAITVWNHDPKTPYSIQWNFDVQQQFPGAVLFDIGYSGSRGVHLTSSFDRNTLDPKYLSLGAGLNAPVANPFKSFVSIGTLANNTVTQRQLLLPFPQFLGVTEINNPYGSSTYHSMQVKLVKRASHGLTLLGAYTWSKLISNVNLQNAPIGTTDNTGVQNYYDLSAERSVSELDQPHNFVANVVYKLPIGRGGILFNHAPMSVDKFIGGWKVTSIVTMQSGFPLVLTSNGTGTGNRPDLVLGVNPRIDGSRSNNDRVAKYFNTAAFRAPQPYMNGTVRRTFTDVRGPVYRNWDASLQKDTKFFGDRIDTEFRVELFDATNSPHFNMPVMALQNANFGKITSTINGQTRDMQLGLKVSF